MATTRLHKALAALALFAAVGGASAAPADPFPSKPIRLIVPFAPGGGTDVVARLVADKMQSKWGQPVIVENRAGAGGNIGAEFVYRSPPDGYILLLTAPAPVSINKSLYRSLSYDPDKLVPVSLISASPNILLVYPKLPIHSVAELIAYAKAHPNTLNYATPGNGTTPHLSTELFKQLAGIDITHVPYKGTGPAIADLMGGQVDIMFAEISTAVALVKSGKLRALAVGSEKRSPTFPDLPTVSETLPGFVSMSSSHLVAPPGTPPAIVAQLSEAVAEAARDPAIIKRLADVNADAIGSTPAEHDKFLKEERKRWGDVIEKTGIKLD